MELTEQYASFGGWQYVYQHDSETLGCRMRFAAYVPPQAKNRKLPVLYWLSGLSCTEQNFITKAGAQKYAAEHGIIIIAPDTSPRGDNVPDAPTYDLGQGAGFYVNATQEPWATHYQMYDYVVSELPALVESVLPASDRRSISGHSMGGHGALVIGLRNPDRYRSISAFSPIVAPSSVPWGQKAFSAYLGDDESSWKQYDAVELIGSSKPEHAILIDQGLGDAFLAEQLRPEVFKNRSDEVGSPVIINMHAGYDHSYYFISSFIGEHIKFHAGFLA